MSKEKQIEEAVEFLNNRINVERNSYFGKGCITIPLIEADKILDILKGYRKQSEGEWVETQREWDFEPYFYTDYTCSVCGDREQDKRHFCPNCGAKMKGGAE